MSGKNIVILVVIVAAAALVGWSMLQTEPPTGTETPSSQTRPSAPATGTAPRLTGEEKRALFEVPPPEAPQQEKDAHFARVVQYAQDGTSIDVTKCVNEPTVLRIKSGTTLTLENNGTDEAIVDLGGTLRKVAPNGAVTLEAGFGKGAGLFGYGCNSGESDTGTGFILVTE